MLTSINEALKGVNAMNEKGLNHLENIIENIKAEQLIYATFYGDCEAEVDHEELQELKKAFAQLRFDYDVRADSEDDSYTVTCPDAAAIDGLPDDYLEITHLKDKNTGKEYKEILLTYGGPTIRAIKLPYWGHFKLVYSNWSDHAELWDDDDVIEEYYGVLFD